MRDEAADVGGDARQRGAAVHAHAVRLQRLLDADRHVRVKGPAHDLPGAHHHLHGGAAPQQTLGHFETDVAAADDDGVPHAGQRLAQVLRLAGGIDEVSEVDAGQVGAELPGTGGVDQPIEALAAFAPALPLSPVHLAQAGVDGDDFGAQSHVHTAFGVLRGAAARSGAPSRGRAPRARRGSLKRSTMSNRRGSNITTRRPGSPRLALAAAAPPAASPPTTINRTSTLLRPGRSRPNVCARRGFIVRGVPARCAPRAVLDEPPTLMGNLGSRTIRRRPVLETPVSALVQRPPVRVPRSTPLREGAALLRQEKTRCLAVMDGDTLVGIFTDRDMVEKCFSSAVTGETELGSVMTAPVLSVLPNATIREALQVLDSGAGAASAACGSRRDAACDHPQPGHPWVYCGGPAGGDSEPAASAQLSLEPGRRLTMRRWEGGHR